MGFIKKTILPGAFLFALCFLVPAGAQAANHYVRQGASGNGSDWTNAYGALPAALVRGDTYYIAGGSYGGYTFDDANSGTAYINIKKAVTADHGTNTGWSDSYGTAQAVINGSWNFAGVSYYLVDGQTGGGTGSWTSGYGFRFNRTGVSDTNAIGLGDNCRYITLRHIEIEGHGDDLNNYSQDGINIGDSDGPLTFSYFYIRNIGRTPIFNRAHNTTYEYFYTGKFESVSAQHSEISSQWISLTKGLSPIYNTTIRYSVFTWAEGTGGLIGEWDGAYIYGNIFVKLTGSEFSSGGNGLIGGWTDRTFKNVLVYNNSFLNCGNAALLYQSIGVKSGTGNIAKNNFFWNAKLDYGEPGFGIYDYNDYYATTHDSSGANDKTVTSQPYAGYLNLDFRMARGTAAGQTLTNTVTSYAGVNITQTYDVDLLGQKRGVDGAWDRGAIEYNSAGGGSVKPGDLNNDSKVDVTDLGILLSNWNKAACLEPCRGDLNQDGKVDVTDLGILLSSWG